MSISNLQETLLMYTKQKSLINEKLTNVMFNLTQATQKTANLQDKYNQKEQYYYKHYEGWNTSSDVYDEYQTVMEQLLKEHEFDLQNIQSWESQLEMDKNNYETQLNVISQYESSWQKLLSNNIKSDFSYGGVQQ